MTGTIFRVTQYGLCEVMAGEMRAAFTLDKLAGYGGQPYEDFGLRTGATVDLETDEEGRIASARLVAGAATAS